MVEEKKGLFGKLTGSKKPSCCDMQIIEEKPEEKKGCGFGTADDKKPKQNDSCC